MDRIGLCIEARSRGKSRFPVRDICSERSQDCGSHWPLRRQEKPLARIILRPYRKPTLVGRGKSPQVNERPSVKELGKLTPYLRKKGCPSSEDLRISVRGLQEIGSTDCLPKTQVSANAKAEV
jgi:hypothetical protein